MSQRGPEHRKILLLQGRNLGDAVIDTSLINSLGASYPEAHLHLFTRPTFEGVFRGNPHIAAQHYAHFPMGTAKQLDPRGAFHLMRQILRLRCERYDLCINSAGDGRENLIGWLVRPRRNAAPVWPKCHRRTRGHQVRPGMQRLVNNPLPIPLRVFNVYAIQNELAGALGCKRIEPPRIYIGSSAAHRRSPPIIAIHPTASQPSKLWPWSNWRELISSLVNEGRAVRLFCAPPERDLITRELLVPLNIPTLQLQASELDLFLTALAEAALLIGLDSLCVHAAYALGVPSVLLNGANDIEVWAPPNCRVISRGEICPSFPCYNKPRCVNTPQQYLCMQVVKVEEVLALVRSQIRSWSGPSSCMPQLGQAV